MSEDMISPIYSVLGVFVRLLLTEGVYRTETLGSKKMADTLQNRVRLG
jgi:hypothetical protein